MLDASAIVLALLNDGDARRVLATESAVVPHLADAEITQALRAHVRRGDVSDTHAEDALATWADLGVRRVDATACIPRIWDLRTNLTAYDATYVALAEALGCTLVTADARLARAPGPTCPITVIRG